MACKRAASCGALIGGALFILVGLLLLTLVPHIVNQQVIERDHLGYDDTDTTKNASERKLNEMTQKWMRPPYDMQMQIWLYTLVNERAYLNGEAKPRFEEIGPFVFRETQQKKFKFVANETRVVYRNTRLYHFNRSASCDHCDLSRPVTIVNPVFQKLVDFALKNFAFKLAIESILVAISRETPFITVPVGEALFDGFEDPIISKVCATPVLNLLCATLPKRVGFLYGQNATDDGEWLVDTGLQGASTLLGKIYAWNNKTKLPDGTWDGKDALNITGFDGQLFPPLMTRTSRLSVFTPLVCRTMTLEYVRDSHWRGVPTYRFQPPASLYDSRLEENRAYCNSKDTPEFFANKTVQIPGCLPYGLLDVSRCQPGQPRVYLSQAHFLDADPAVRAAVDGVHEAHPTWDTVFVDFEPTSAVPMRAARRGQVNFGMIKGNLNALAKTKNIILPVLWLNETAIVDDATHGELLGSLIKIQHIAFLGGVACIVFGVLCWFVYLSVHVVFNYAKPQEEEQRAILEEPQEDNEENE